MSDIIRLLPDSVANQIAAGEVIQRPASVVKELVENAVDAGASRIEVIIRDAGRTLIQVVDDGKGMSDTDARMAFERHATSKITQADDLFSLHTMGFRGEALASICAVAQVDLRTRTAESEVGTRIIINGSKIESQEPEGCAKGCNMMVKNLFFNVPARRKFLKKDAVEFANIAREFERMALVNPGVDLTLIHNDTIVHQLMRGTFKQRIADLFGKALDKQLIPVSTSTSIVSVEGFVGRPEFARRRNALQYLTVSGRHMRHPYFHKAVMTCYEQLIPADQQPNYFLNFTVDPATIDVNIHPTKNEIKFENESAIWQILVAAVKETLGRFNAMPGIDFDVADSPEIPVFNPNSDGEHGIEIDESYNPFSPRRDDTAERPSAIAGGGGIPSSFGRQAVSSDWDKLYEGFMSQQSLEVPAHIGGGQSALFGDDISVDSNAVPESASLQVRNRFIMSASASGVMVIDQHRAHVRVLYERYLAALRTGEVASQRVLFPDVLTFDAAHDAVMHSLESVMTRAGFDVTCLGQSSWSVQAVPAVLADANPNDVVRHIVDDALDGIPDTTDELLQHLALSMARSAAITAGRRPSSPEREQLLSDLLRLSSPNFTPDGLPVIRIMTEEEIEKMF